MNKELNNFIIKEPFPFDLGFAVAVIARIGFENWFKSQLDTFCNCTKIFKDGSRCTQTNDVRYKYEITTCVKMIEQFGEDKKEEYYNKLIERHNANIEFENINGYDYSITSNKKKTTTTRKHKTDKSNTNDKPKKETAAERKLKAQAIKLNSLMFKVKPTL